MDEVDGVAKAITKPSGLAERIHDPVIFVSFVLFVPVVFKGGLYQPYASVIMDSASESL